MKKIGTKLLVVLTMALGGFVAAQQPTTAHASNTISSIPSGNFKISQADYTFRFQTVKSGHKKAQVLVIGDFRQPTVRLATPTKAKVSKNRRTLTVYYKLNKTTYRMDLYKYSNSKYKVKLNKYKAGLLPSYKGKSYTASVTKSSPAQDYANSYTKSRLTKLFSAEYKASYDENYKSNYKTAYDSYLNQVIDAYNKQAQQDYKDGKNGDPSTPEAQQIIKNAATKYVNDNTDKITQAVTQSVTQSMNQAVNKNVNKALQNLVAMYNKPKVSLK